MESRPTVIAGEHDAGNRPKAGRRGHLAHGRAEVDVLLVYAPSTLGLRMVHDQLAEALRALGLTVAVACAQEGPARWLKVAYPLIDLVECIALRRATDAACRRHAPRAIIYETGMAVLLEPRERLRRGAVRFDAPAILNRPGGRNVIQRRLQRRRFNQVRLLLPATTGAADYADRAGMSTPSVTMFSPLADSPDLPSSVRSDALCYAGDPHKKGLDVVAAAWNQVDTRDHRLIVAGIEESRARSFLVSRRVALPSGVKWAGRLSSSDYRRLSARVKVHIAAPRFDEYAATQLEALLDGAVLVCGVPQRGPFEPLQLARKLDARLVDELGAPETLAQCIGTALSFSEDESRRYRTRALGMLDSYRWPAFEETLSQVVHRVLWLDPTRTRCGDEPAD